MVLSPIELLASAIATKEGFYAPGNPPPVRNHNPGDLRASPLNRFHDAHNFVMFQSNAEGIAALYHQLLLMALRGETVRQAIAIWAPPADGNNTQSYFDDVTKWTGLDIDKPIWDYLQVQNLYTYFKDIPK